MTLLAGKWAKVSETPQRPMLASARRANPSPVAKHWLVWMWSANQTDQSHHSALTDPGLDDHISNTKDQVKENDQQDKFWSV